MGEKALDKFDVYDILGILVPGVLLVAWMPVCFPAMVAVGMPAKFPDAFAALALVALAIFAGQLLQALGSLAEPLLCRTWGGQHSKRAFRAAGNPCFSRETAARIRRKVTARLWTPDAPDADSPSDDALYECAAHLGASDGRVAKFNSLYAYHRGMVVSVLVLLCTAALTSNEKIAEIASSCHHIALPVLGVVLLALVWNRTRRRSIYFVRELLLSAETVIDSSGEQPA